MAIEPFRIFVMSYLIGMAIALANRSPHTSASTRISLSVPTTRLDSFRFTGFVDTQLDKTRTATDTHGTSSRMACFTGVSWLKNTASVGLSLAHGGQRRVTSGCQ